MKKISVSVKTKLIFTFIAISSTIIFVVTYFNFTANVKLEKSNFIQNSLIQTNLFADFTVSALVFEDYDGVVENLMKLKNDKNILRVIIYDNNKKLFAEYNPLKIKEPAKLYPNKVFLDSTNEDFLKYGTLRLSIPIKHKDKIYGTLYVEKSTEIITQLLKKVFSELILFTLILLLVIYTVSVFLSNYLLNPILSLANTAEKIAQSRNYSIRVNYNSKNEIGSLYKAFNMLLEDTENLTNNLEREVEIRTKELEESLKDLKQTQQKLIASEKMSALGNLVSGIAHEVNTPLGNAITGSSIIIKESENLIFELENQTLKKSTMEKRLSVLNESSKLLLKTLNYASGLIKSFKQISVDQVTNDIRVFEIKSYIQEIFLTNHNKLKLVPVEIEIQGADLEIRTSPGIIAQIFNNLIENSIIHAFENFVGIAKINVLIKDNKDYLTIEYKDNGNGIKEDIKDNVYEPFITTKRNAGGTGLGLNIIYNLVHQKLKGTLDMQTKVNLGTKFTITIPKENSFKEIK